LKPSTPVSSTQAISASATCSALPTIGAWRLPRTKPSIRCRFVQPGPKARAIASTLEVTALLSAVIGSSMPKRAKSMPSEPADCASAPSTLTWRR
jgi:hypothetical protein